MLVWEMNFIALACLVLLLQPVGAQKAREFPGFAKEKLVAWCIVPFDSAKRGPEERAQMLKDLGLRRCAYDWRAEHVPSFEAEIQAYAKHGIDFFAFWGAHEEAFALFEKYKLTPQIWQTAPSPEGKSDEEKVERAVQALLPMVKRTRDLGCSFGLYNHGGWGGKPENLAKVCQALRETHAARHVGIVYNFHHAHDEIPNMAASLALMKPYLLCLNLNGMNDRAEPKILTIGQGKHDARLLEMVATSGYEGPIGIIDHQNDRDAEHALRENLEGLAKWKGSRPQAK